MKRLLLILLLLPLAVSAQVTDDFSDGDFTQNPTWSGTTDLYIVNTGYQLQINASAAGESYLSLPYSETGEVEWRFWIRQAFAPSANNYTDVYLVADKADLTSVTEGYFIRFGEAGSNDAIELFRLQNGTSTSVLRGTDGAIAASSQVSVKVSCDADGNWTLMTDYNGGDAHSTEAQGSDNAINRTGYFGFYSKYTASNATKFFFDDVYIGQPIVDTEAPKLLTLSVVGGNSLRLVFDEPLAQASALAPANYSVSNGIGNPSSASLQGNEVTLVFADSFVSDVSYTLSVQGLSDMAGNTIDPLTRDFSVHIFAYGDVVVNEIMADPTPVVGLPEYEYVELYNTTDIALDMSGCSITIGTSVNALSGVMEAHNYLILCHNDAVQALSQYGQCLGFQSFSVANASALITLSSDDGTVISQVPFKSSWYHDTDKDDGGYSVEQIDPLSTCLGEINWRASNDPTGGTPGRVNSVDGVLDTAPSITSLSMFGENTLQLHFDQPMDLASLQNAQYQIVELGTVPSQIDVNPNDATFVEIVFDVVFVEGEIYTLSVKNVLNCKGVAMVDADMTFGLPSTLNVGDVVINEILFNPINGGVKYVELYNNTSFTFDVSDLRLGMIKTTFPNPADTVMKVVAAESYLFTPNSYLLLSTNSVIVAQQFECSIENYVDMASFPTYPTSGATVLLTDKNGNVIDRMDYSEKLHSPLLKETKGVSLERVSADVASDNADNWHSAAESVHFGTPGRANSMAQNAEITDNEIEISPEVFSPDGDGFDDVCMINYNLDEPGYTMNVYIFNTGGQLVRHLAKGAVVGQEGSLPWNGLDDNGGRLPVGIYIVITEVYNFDGKVRKHKSPVVLMAK